MFGGKDQDLLRNGVPLARLSIGISSLFIRIGSLLMGYFSRLLIRLGAEDEDLGDGVPPVVGAGGDVRLAVDATVDVDEFLSGCILRVAGVGLACRAGHVGAQLVVGLGT